MNKFMKGKIPAFTMIEVLVIIMLLSTLTVSSTSRIGDLLDRPKDLEVTRDMSQYELAAIVLTAEGKDFTIENINKHVDKSLGFSDVTKLSTAPNPYNNSYIIDIIDKDHFTVTSNKIYKGKDKGNKVLTISRVNGVVKSGYGDKPQPIEPPDPIEPPIEKPVEPPLTPIINIPDVDIPVGAIISWGTNVGSGDIVEEEWIGKQDSYLVEGKYTVKLRVKNDKGAWSDWAEKVINVVDGSKAQQILTGSEYTMALLGNGTVKAWGLGSAGQLGNGFTSGYRIPTTVLTGLGNIKQIETGDMHSAAVLKDGTVWVWGYNTFGQLGNGTKTTSLTPIQIVGLTNVKQVSVEENFTIILLENGTVWSCGRNVYGQLGDGTTTDKLTPVQVNGVLDAVQITTGDNYAAALLDDGTIRAWGYNSQGQLGDGSTTHRSTPVKVEHLTDVRQISAGYRHMVAVLNDDTVWTWGYNSYGQLGDGTTTNSKTPVGIGFLNAKHVEAATFHTVVLKNDGTVWTWGANASGQLGDGTTTDSKIPIQTVGLANVKQISAKYGHNAALLSNGIIKTWGKNDWGQIGDNTNTARTTPVTITW